MGKSQVKVATIVANSTDDAWSQAYHAGGVAAVVSIHKKETADESPSLSIVGKDLLNTFESEYFTLETKSLVSIKQAVEITYKKSKDTHDISLIVTANIQNAVYIVLAGTGKILLIRKGAVATLLEQHEGDVVLSASGFLESGDMMILETLSFEESVSSSVLLETLINNSPTDAAEILSPRIHKEKDGSATALIYKYHEEAPQSASIAMEAPKAPEEVMASTDGTSLVQEEPRQRSTRTITHRQKIFLTIAVVLAIVFAATIYFSLEKKLTGQNTARFSQLYPPALTKYQEGQGLENLNASLARNDFVQAQQMLTSAKGKFPANSSEEKQIITLLAKVDSQLTPTSTAATAAVTKEASGTDAFLDFAAQHANTKYIAQDDSNYYFADNSGISKVAKSGGSAQQIIQNGGDWKSLGGFATYLGNMYVLDTADGIDKYAVTSNGFGNKVAYFSGTTPDLSKATSVAIDGSVWILTSDGTITSYTKGTQDTFTISGLSQPLANPTQIVTTVNDTNIYILDNGNSRIVVLKKDGTFVADYGNNVLKSATHLDVDEANKKVYFLSSGSVYELDMK